MDRERYEVGLKTRGEVLGEEYVRKSVQGATDFNREFQDFVTEYCWGGLWSSPHLERAQRSILLLGMLAALGRSHEFELHFRGAIRNGVTRDQLRDVLHQIAMVCGIPAGMECFRIARRVLDETDAEG